MDGMFELPFNFSLAQAAGDALVRWALVGGVNRMTKLRGPCREPSVIKCLSKNSWKVVEDI